MTWSYDETEPTDKDKVRGVIGDTNEQDQLLSDEVINTTVVDRPSVRTAAIECIRRILAKLARDTDRNHAGINSLRSQKFQHYRELLEFLTQEQNTELEVYVGGLSKSEKQTVRQDTDFPQHNFRIGRDDDIENKDSYDDDIDC